MPPQRHPFGAGQTQRRALRNSSKRIEVDPLDEAPTTRRDPRPIAEILLGPAPVRVPEVPVHRDRAATQQLRRPHDSTLIVLWICIGVTIGMIATVLMLRA